MDRNGAPGGGTHRDDVPGDDVPGDDIPGVDIPRDDIPRDRARPVGIPGADIPRVRARLVGIDTAFFTTSCRRKRPPSHPARGHADGGVMLPSGVAGIWSHRLGISCRYRFRRFGPLASAPPAVHDTRMRMSSMNERPATAKGSIMTVGSLATAVAWTIVVRSRSLRFRSERPVDPSPWVPVQGGSSMTVSVTALKSRIAHIRQELEDVSMALDSLAEAPGAQSVTLPRAREVDRTALLSLLDAAYAEMGLDLSEPAITAEQLQALMLEEGVRPEDRIFSSGIIAAREE